MHCIKKKGEQIWSFWHFGGNVYRCYPLLLKQDKSKNVKVQECVCLLYKHTRIISNKASRPRSGHGKIQDF